MITFSYLKSQLYIENLEKIEVLRTKLHSLILSRQNELRLRWEMKAEQIYYDLSLYDLSFNKKNIFQTIQSSHTPINEKDLLIYKWNQAVQYISYHYFFRPDELTEDELYSIFRVIKPKTRYQPFQEFPEYVRYIQSEDHPLTRAALLQSIVYNLKPFPELNEPFSHLAFQTVLYWAGWDLRGIVNIEEQYFRDRAYYKDLITNTYTSGNVTQWIEYASEALIKQLAQTIETISTRQPSTEVDNEFFRLNDRQKEILAFLDSPETSITNRKLQKMTSISQMTAARDLSKLVELGLIFSRGKGRAVSYSKT